MMRLAWLFLALAATRPAAAQDYTREALRIPMPAAGPRGLEALLIRPAGNGPFPLALLSHGAPRQGSDRAGMSANGLYRQGIEFARRGFASLIVTRRGYGTSGGSYAENSGSCSKRDYLRTAKASATDLRAAVAAMKNRTDVTTNGFIAVGISAGGFASVALTADPPPGLAAAINFAGGRGSRADDDVCDEDSLVRAVCHARQDIAHSDAVGLRAERQVLRTGSCAQNARSIYRRRRTRSIHRGGSLRRRRPYTVRPGCCDLDADGRRFPAHAESGPARSLASASACGAASSTTPE